MANLTRRIIQVHKWMALITVLAGFALLIVRVRRTVLVQLKTRRIKQP